MIPATTTIWPSWATCAPWSAIAPMPICAAFRSPPSLTARCSRASCHGSAERAGAGRRRKPTVRFTAAGKPSVTRSFRKHISFRSCKNAERHSRPRLRCCACMGTALQRSPCGKQGHAGAIRCLSACASFSKRGAHPQARGYLCAVCTPHAAGTIFPDFPAEHRR